MWRPHEQPGPHPAARRGSVRAAQPSPCCHDRPAVRQYPGGRDGRSESVVIMSLNTTGLMFESGAGLRRALRAGSRRGRSPGPDQPRRALPRWIAVRSRPRLPGISRGFAASCAVNGVQRSVGHHTTCYDNAIAGPFVATYKENSFTRSHGITSPRSGNTRFSGSKANCRLPRNRGCSLLVDMPRTHLLPACLGVCAKVEVPTDAGQQSGRSRPNELYVERGPSNVMPAGVRNQLIEAVAADVRRDHAATLSAAHLITERPVAWHSLASAWDNLPPDPYLTDGVRYRFRRYSRLGATPTDDGWLFDLRPHAPFTQPADINPLYAGVARLFPPIEPSVVESHEIQSLLRLDLDIISKVEGRGQYSIGLHMVRVLARQGENPSPAPEGRHRDGHLFVFIHLLARIGCNGGMSRAYGSAANLVLQTTMQRMLDTVVVDDRRVEHEVERIAAVNEHGWRDTLLVDIDPLG
jgi:hypothetical protein